jgi:NADPH-dependent FMN reductase
VDARAGARVSTGGSELRAADTGRGSVRRHPRVGVAGAVKNAFDWLVGGGELYRKPVAVLGAGTSDGLHARRMMAQTLTWQSAYVVSERGIAWPRTRFDDAGRITDAATAAALRSVTETLLVAPMMTATDLVARATAVVGSLDIDVAHIAPAA